MARRTLPASLEQVFKERLDLTHREKKLADLERRIIQEMGRVLPSLGYRIVSANGRASKRPSLLIRKRSLDKDKSLKCPRCDRHFSLKMHVARHLSAIHGAKTAGRKAQTSKT